MSPNPKDYNLFSTKRKAMVSCLAYIRKYEQIFY